MESNAWNIVTGCERLTPGCDNCPTYWGYKERGEDYHPKFNENLLSEPLLNKVPTRYFVAAGSDMFHEAIRLEDIEKAFIVMHMANWHTYEIGSKRIERMAVLSNRGLVWEPHMIAVTGVEESKYKWRIDCLREINARRMVSFGPLVGRVGDVDMTGIEFAGVVVEHWGKPRPVKPEWVTEIEDQCINQGVILSSRYWLCEA
jgi:protein gp37